MKHLKRYNEGIVDKIKDKFSEMSRNKIEKSINNNLGNSLKAIKLPIIKSIEVTPPDKDSSYQYRKPFYVTIETNPLPWNKKMTATVKYFAYQILRDDVDKINISIKSVTFINAKLDEAKYYGYGRSTSDTYFHDSEIGEVNIEPTSITLNVSSGSKLGNTYFDYDETTLSSILSKFIKDNLDTLSDIYKKIGDAVNKRKLQKAKEEEAENKRISRGEAFFNNEEAIKECFLEVIDMGDDYEITSNKSTYSPLINIYINIKGIDVENQQKSKYISSKNTTAYIDFNEAHINITDELFDVMKAIQDGKSHLLSIDEEINMKTIFKKDKLVIILSLD